MSLREISKFLREDRVVRYFGVTTNVDWVTVCKKIYVTVNSSWMDVRINWRLNTSGIEDFVAISLKMKVIIESNFSTSYLIGSSSLSISA